MEYEQQSMGSRTKDFLSVLSGLDWQIAVTTTDPNSSQWGDGRFVPLKGLSSQYILQSTLPQTQAQTVLSNTLQRSETGSGSEQGIRATYRVVERAFTNSNPNHAAFFRPGAHFATILISDEDESDNTTKNDPLSLTSFIGKQFQNQKNFLFNSIITIPGDSNCKSSHGYTYGDRYKMMSNLTGGIIDSVCATNYADQVKGIAEKIRAMTKTITLQCQPVPGTPITIMKNGSPYNNNFSLNSLQLSFEVDLGAGNYQVNYSCLK